MRIPRSTFVRPEFLTVRSRAAGSRTVFAVGGSTDANSSFVRPSGLCELACNALPEPARSICKAAC
jgi:hypothetical protein